MNTSACTALLVGGLEDTLTNGVENIGVGVVADEEFIGSGPRSVSHCGIPAGWLDEGEAVKLLATDARVLLHIEFPARLNPNPVNPK